MCLRTAYIIFLLAIFSAAGAQDAVQYWHGKERTLLYKPVSDGFEIINGPRRFNRALYGTNTGFRVEAGDLPEFAMYLPGMGGNFKMGIIVGNESKWLIDANYIRAVYSPGKMSYEIKDSLMPGAILLLSVLPLAAEEGMIISVRFTHVTNDVKFFWAFGGVSKKKFSRDGDIGADPESSFYLSEENSKFFGRSKGNTFSILENDSMPIISAIVPFESDLRAIDVRKQESPLAFYRSAPSLVSAWGGTIAAKETVYHFLLTPGLQKHAAHVDSVARLFATADSARLQLASRIAVVTPDPYINNLGGALSMAADAIWENPSFLHGAVAWRMRLPAWRGAYAADPLGWHDRARTHFNSYALSQVTTPENAPVVMDTALHLARHLEKIGVGMFTSGYICRNPNGDIRPHHYDMNLVFIDQLMNHFSWTGDTAYVKKMWPVIERHLAWEKRNFDADGDGLYDAYACIWASDALQYSGGGVTHSSAYNYRIFKTAAELAAMIGVDGSAYKKESEKILQAVNRELWMPALGRYAEYKDLLGNKLLHPVPGIWTIYHALDAKLPDPFQAWQATRYVDTDIPHIPIKAKGLDDDSMYLLSTSNWQPYTWSVNNVALAENLHMALAYWQANRPDKAYRLWESALKESMYLGASPGGFQQLSFYDAVRGQLYRDFADPVGMAARTLVEGVFGIQPGALHDTLTIKPGYPVKWNNASLKLPDISFSFMRGKESDVYNIRQSFPKLMNLKLQIPATRVDIEWVKMDGKKIGWKAMQNSIGHPLIEITAPKKTNYTITIRFKGNMPAKIACQESYIVGDTIDLKAGPATIQSLYDPQKVLTDRKKITAVITSSLGNKTVFVLLKQGSFSWWQPLCFAVKEAVNIKTTMGMPAVSSETKFEKINLTNFYNEKVTNIFKQQYLSPRPTSPTLQLPTQGIGNWCYPLTIAEISDSGLRAQAGINNEIILPQGIPFSTPGDSNKNNIIFTSQWDNFPDSITIPLSGKSSRAYMLLAGSTNPMQSRMVNGELRINYTDGSSDLLSLKNPENWWPIEQDYLDDGYAFTTGANKPLRYYLKKGIASTTWSDYSTIRGFSNRGIDGGAATVLDLPLDMKKELKSVVIHTIANDVVIGLMSLTLVR